MQPSEVSVFLFLSLVRISFKVGYPTASRTARSPRKMTPNGQASNAAVV